MHCEAVVENHGSLNNRESTDNGRIPSDFHWPSLPRETSESFSIALLLWITDRGGGVAEFWRICTAFPIGWEIPVN